MVLLLNLPFSPILFTPTASASGLAVAFAGLTLVVLVLLALAGALVALYGLAPRLRTRFDSWSPSDTGSVYAETLAALQRGHGSDVRMAPMPDPHLQPALLPVTAGGEAAHG